MRTSRVVLLAFVVVAVALAVRGGCQRPVPEMGKSVAATKGATTGVLIVTIDTLRADAVGAYGAGEARTPGLDRLAAEGTRFERAYAPAPITLTSHATLLTGLDPPAHGGRHNGLAIRPGVATLAESFRAAGFATAAFVTAFPLDRRFGLSRGFDTYSDRMPRGADGRPANERPGRAAADEAIAWLQALGGRRFFLWVHVFEPHAPYGDASTGRPAARRYADEVEEADRQLGRVIDALGPRRDATLIVAAADHGEAFGEHGEIGHSLFVYDTTLRVPLIIAGPGVPRGAAVAEPVGLVDLAPTIRQALGLPAADTDGVDLSPSWRGGGWERRRGLYAESFAPLLDFGWSSLRSLRTPEWKYIEAPQPELFRIAEDPLEARNLAAAEPSTAGDLAARVARVSGPELPAPASAADPEAARRLRALGYSSGSPTGGTPLRARPDPKERRDLAARLASIASGELTGAHLESALEAVLRDDPANPQANVRLGYVRIDQGRCGDAERLFTRAIREGLPGADAHLGLAACLGARGAVADAQRELERANRQEPENAIVLANLGIASAATGDDDRAIERLRQALTLDPDLHEARFHLARALARRGRRQEAAREARELLSRLPPSAPQRAEVERLLRSLS